MLWLRLYPHSRRQVAMVMQVGMACRYYIPSLLPLVAVAY